MNSNDIMQFREVCKILKKTHNITNVEDTDKSIKVFVNNVGVVIDKKSSVDNTYKTLTKFLNLLRK